MGFSVSGSFAILVLASFIAFGMLHTAGANSFERVTDATKDTYDDDLDRRNTAIQIARLDHAGHLDVNVTNRGTTALDLNATDVIVDGEYIPREDTHRFRVAGKPNSELWLPGEKLWVRVKQSALPDNDPNRVKVVTEYGVADVGVVP